MLKGITNGILIEIKDINSDLKKLEEKLSKNNFFKDVPFYIKESDKSYYDLVSTFLKSKGYSLFIYSNEKVNKLDLEVEVIKNESKQKQFSEETLIVRRTLRSGQNVNFDGNIVVVGDVNPGAEVIAAGDILVFGKAMGLLHAGKDGDRSKFILALKLNVIQIRIADIYAKGDNSYSFNKIESLTGEKAFIDDKGALIIQEYKILD